MVTLDPGVVKAAMAIAKRMIPPMDALSRVIDVALAEWTERNRRGKQ